MTESKKIYSQEEMKIALLEQSNTGILATLNRLETRFNHLESKMDSHFHWVMGSMSILYISLIGTLVTALAKSLRWF